MIANKKYLCVYKMSMTADTNKTADCPICLESLDTNINHFTTPCGHQFHGNCFMMHTAINGYACPCCRHKMIEERNVEPDDDDEDEDEDEDEEDDDEETLGSEDTRDYNFGGRFILREDELMFSFRWFYQRLNEEELEEDEYNLSELNTTTEINDDSDIIYDENKEQVENLIKRMKQINKLSYEKLLAAFMYKNCKDFRYNYYAEDMCSDVSRMINDIHQRMLRSEPSRP